MERSGVEVDHAHRNHSKSNPLRTPWNKGRLVGQKRPLRPKEVWAIRVRLQIKHNKRDLAMFNLAIDSKLRGCDLVCLRVDVPRQSPRIGRAGSLGTASFLACPSDSAL